MVPTEPHSQRRDHGHGHAAASSHPAQTAAWSILRMAVLSRVVAALLVIAALWILVWLAMR